MPELIRIRLNGRELRVPFGTVVSAVLLNAGEFGRRSTSGQPRTAFCGMGTCFECRATVDGVPHRRTCQLLCRPGMTVETA